VPDARTLPIPAAHREFTVKAGGTAVPREHHLVSASVVKVANRIAWARLGYLDGAAASSDFPLSNSSLFVPGQAVEVLAGAGSSMQSLFKGVVVRQSLRARDRSAPQLVVECRHTAMRLTAARRNATFVDQTDSQVIENLLAAAKIQADVEPTKVKHKQLVQFHTTDWDFLTSRAGANGKLVLPKGDGLAVKAPATGGQPVCQLQFGATLLELDAEIDARRQFAAVRGVSWDPARQAVLQIDGDPPAFNGPGNLAPGDLAAVAAADRLELRHAAVGEAEAKAWAESTWLLSRLNKVSGRCKCEGIGTVDAGDVVTLAGIGQRFNGDVFVTGVRHEFDLVEGWKTHVQFGGTDEEWPTRDGISAPAAGGLLARVAGLQTGVVVSNEDPDGEHRVRIRLPLVNAGDDGVWARVACLDAGADRGFHFWPEVGDEVVAGFFDDDPRCAVILGMLPSSAKPSPLKGSDANDEKVYKSRSGMRVSFNDKTKALRLDTPAGNSLAMSEDEKSLILADQNGNKIALTPDGVRIESAKALTFKAGADVGVESPTALSVKAGTELTLEGKLKAELSSPATTKVMGGMVQIN
jgi:Rhs element Vgr protein